MATRLDRSLPVTDLTKPIMFSDPFPRYAELRRSAPVSLARHRETRRMTSYMLTRHADVLTLHTDPRFSSDTLSQGAAGRLMRFSPKVVRVLGGSMIVKDGSAHKSLPGVGNKGFTPRKVDRGNGGDEKKLHDLLEGPGAQE